MKKTLMLLIIGFIFAMIPLTIGCSPDNSLATKAATNVIESAGIDGYSVEDGKATKITTRDSESHQMIIKMRLLQYGMSPNLEDYGNAYLVDMKNDAGKTITVVVVNENGTMKALIPENIEK